MQHVLKGKIHTHLYHFPVVGFSAVNLGHQNTASITLLKSLPFKRYKNTVTNLHKLLATYKDAEAAQFFPAWRNF